MNKDFGTLLRTSSYAITIIALTWFIEKDRVFIQLKLGEISTKLVYYWLKFIIPLVFFIILLGFILSLIIAD